MYVLFTSNDMFLYMMCYASFLRNYLGETFVWQMRKNEWSFDMNISTISI